MNQVEPHIIPDDPSSNNFQVRLPLEKTDVQLEGVSYKEMTKLSMLAYSGIYIPNKFFAQRRVRQMVEKYAPEQEIVWGPVAAKSLFDVFTTAMLYIVKDTTKEKPTYTVVARGTNVFSWSSFLIQDMWISHMEPWAVASHYADIAEGQPVAISKGANLTLNIMKGLKSNGKTIKEYLNRVLANEDTQVQFTGHSLGGVSSQILSMWLLEEFRQQGVNVTNRFSMVSIAAPSPGNSAFVAHLDRLYAETDNQYVRLINPYDVSNIYWNARVTASEVVSIYASADIYPDSVGDGIVASVFNLAHGEDYTHALQSYAIDFPINPEIDNWVMQGLYQHLFSYALFYLRDDEPKLIQEMGVELAPTIAMQRSVPIMNRTRHLRTIQKECGAELDMSTMKSLLSVG